MTVKQRIVVAYGYVSALCAIVKKTATKIIYKYRRWETMKRMSVGWIIIKITWNAKALHGITKKATAKAVYMYRQWRAMRKATKAVIKLVKVLVPLTIATIKSISALSEFVKAVSEIQVNEEQN